ncbi:hypothetical protein OPT61_g9324 [Boeremia exigua]|uniref:Uncharacterized protein n=1 Tax=Boeremia exigua TaxID=749465 RepID=A0ACC2HUY2_9PLEO|nr:hypothetical protein OPT61_g9324 [Boeremia exigua]
MAHHISPTPKGPASQQYHLVKAAGDPILVGTEETFASGSIISTRSDQKSHTQLWHASQILLTAVVPLAALATWLGYVRANPRLFDTFAGEKIGGRLTQAQAKAIDAATGAVLAPLFMVALNHIWFGSALRHQVGSYDVFNLRSLLLGKTWRLFLFALLTLLSAVSRTALSNTIAYEAFSEIGSLEAAVDLRLQTDVAINSASGYTNSLKLQLYNFDMAQNARVAKDMSALLTDISYEDAAPKLTNGTYIGFNATQQSLDSLPQTIVGLTDVPAYRLSVDCAPSLPWSVSVMQPLGFFNTQIGLMLNTTSTSNNTIFQANYPGVPDNLRLGEADTFSYVAFSMGYREVYLGNLNRFNLTNKTDESAYGDIHYQAFNMTQWGFHGTQVIMSAGGLRCTLYSEQGTVNAARKSTSTNSAGTWTIVSSAFPDSQTKSIVPSTLSLLQWTNLNFHAPGQSVPGLGPALNTITIEQVGNWGERANDTFTNFASNYLYASGEAQRIMYEVAASSTNASRALPEYFVKVPATASQEKYRITYVPSILLVGLLALLGSSLITGAMAWLTRRSVSARVQRQVDVTRLLVDSVVGLEGDREGMAAVAQRSSAEIDGWAAGYKRHPFTSRNGRLSPSTFAVITVPLVPNALPTLHCKRGPGIPPGRLKWTPSQWLSPRESRASYRLSSASSEAHCTAKIVRGVGISCNEVVDRMTRDPGEVCKQLNGCAFLEAKMNWIPPRKAKDAVYGTGQELRGSCSVGAILKKYCSSETNTFGD